MSASSAASTAPRRPSGPRATPIAASLLFADEAAAEQFTEAYATAQDAEPLTVAEVTAYCLD